MIESVKPFFYPSPEQLSAGFLALLPRFHSHAALCFRDVACPDTKADRVAETIALAWKWYCRLQEQGKDVAHFPVVFICLVARGVRNGRRLCGQGKPKDVLNPVAQRRHGFRVESLPISTRTSIEELHAQPQGQKLRDTFEERLRDDALTPIPDQVAFRIDWPMYFNTLCERDRQLAEFLALGHMASKAAEKFGVSRARVTQLRQRWCREWQRWQDADAVRGSAN